jgi:hypothetical protein
MRLAPVGGRESKRPLSVDRLSYRDEVGGPSMSAPPKMRPGPSERTA